LGPERLGWIRVICERDATPETIRHVQRRLSAHGYYQGPYNGRYDAETARGVARFQQERHIRHGGYLSVQTVEALDAGPPIVAPPAVLVSPCGLAACVPSAPVGLTGPYGPYATPPYRSLLNWPGKSIY
jgi:peptidoglycan hydrolase-like protein with peptidoglycan-binding domain